MVHGIFMEGARWDTQQGIIMESRLKELHPMMPVINIRVRKRSEGAQNFLNLKIFLSRRSHRTRWTFGTCTSAPCTRPGPEDPLTYGRST